MSNTAIPDISSITQEQLDKLVDRFQNEGATLKEIKGITEQETEAMYTVAHGLLLNQRYDEAEPMLRYLCLNDHLSQKFWLALGVCLKKQDQFEDAVNAFGIAGLLDIEDPRAAFEAAECHVRLDNRDEAISALEAAVSFSGDQEKFAGTKKRAETMLAVLNKSEA